ncbi:unnamed protein product, partial [Candidula unifasciata]
PLENIYMRGAYPAFIAPVARRSVLKSLVEVAVRLMLSGHLCRLFLNVSSGQRPGQYFSVGLYYHPESIHGQIGLSQHTHTHTHKIHIGEQHCCRSQEFSAHNKTRTRMLEVRTTLTKHETLSYIRKDNYCTASQHDSDGHVSESVSSMVKTNV